MPRDIVYFDLETQRTANDAGGWARKGDMRMSVGVIYSSATGRYEVFGEAQVNQLVEAPARRSRGRLQRPEFRLPGADGLHDPRSHRGAADSGSDGGHGK